MKRRPWIAVLLVTLGIGPSVAQEMRRPLQAEITLSTDYIFRGYSRSPSTPVFQAGLGYRHRTGLLAGFWGSTMDLDLDEPFPDGPRAELRLLAGYGGNAGPRWSWDSRLVYYWFPNPGSSLDISYGEVQGAARYRDLFAATVAYTRDFLGSKRDGVFLELIGSYPLPRKFYLSGGIGAAYLEPRENDYLYGQVAAGWTNRRCLAELGYFDSGGRPIPVWGKVVDGSWVFRFVVRIP